MSKPLQAAGSNLPVHRVEVVESGKRGRRGWLTCKIGENMMFDTARLEAYCIAPWDSRVYDAFVVAAAAQFCDHTKARPSTAWGREIMLRIPVHDPALWASGAVSTALHSALTFLTGDRWQITFTSRRSSAAVPRQQQFSMPDDSPVIMPFSDGLDSYAVAGLAKQEHGTNLIQVRMGSKLADGFRHAAGKVPFAMVPYQVRCGKAGSVESSARSRGFRFALLSGVAAYLSGARQIIVPESGQGVLGPTFVPVGQAYEDYRNHPLFTTRMEELLLALFGHKVRYTYPRLWRTKGETLAEFLASYPDDANWKATRSCWQGQRHVSVSGKMRQCGICAACMLRRMSIRAIGSTEDADAYVWNDLSAPKFEEGADPAFEIKNPRGAMYEHAIAGTLHLDHLADLLESATNRTVVDRHIGQLSRSLGCAKEHTRAKAERLIRQHREEWKIFLNSLGPRSFVAQWASRVQ